VENDSIAYQKVDEADPGWEMGDRLLGIQKKQRLLKNVRLLAVWIGLVLIVSFVLLQFRIEPSYAFKHSSFVLMGVLTTLGVSLASIGFATVFALLGALGRLSNNALAQGISGFYVSIIRGTPLLVQIYIIYLGLPQIGQILITQGFTEAGRIFTLTALQSGILALSLNYGAYMTEIFRAGIQSIGHGQREAAKSIGMSEWQILRRIILPQAVRVIIPDIGNSFIAMQKDSSLVSVMGIWEITYRANRLARKDLKFMEMFLLAALIYWIMTIISSWGENLLERRLSRAYERS
jgi:polar amino acid transport system permease protein